jgi:mono/diheme cytochrome c family protein
MSRTSVAVTAAALAAAATLVATTAARAGGDDRAARGRYLVTIAGCNDCHTPLKMGPGGPQPDGSRLLSGHPEALTMPPPPAIPPGPWMASGSATMTAWAGPWGVSFAANLTPDRDTGLGRWTEREFVDAMRSGRHQGRGRPILPPMPVQNVAAMTDADLSAVFAYLRSIPAIRNAVPDPVPPAPEATQAASRTPSR